jgi:UDP-2,3-diacylglucosamine pyrophosphatase LpxH
MKSSTQKYYLVSDLHMGGDGALQHCDYTAEFIEFLKGLEKEGPDTELLIVGDTFGFWELTLVHGVEKLDHIVAAHQAIFDQLRATGERIKITMMVGNHDYDLACNAAFAARLRAYNIYRQELGADPPCWRQEDLDRAWAAARRIQCLP